MTDVVTPHAAIRRARALPDGFWQNVMVAPWRYDLFSLLRRIDAQAGERYPLGRAPLPRFEPLRIGQKPSLGFAPSTLAGVSRRDASTLYDVSILSFGLFGPNGPLPVHLTEYARERIDHHQDESLTAFTDLFHHRLTLLFYRAWADAQPTVSLDRADNRRFEQYVASLIGMGQPGQLHKGSLSPHARFALAGHLTRNGRDPEGLEKILRHYFGVPVRVVENVPQWMPLSPRERARLQGGRHAPRLGESAFLGEAVRDVTHCFRIDIGPLNQASYRQFLPGNDAEKRVRDWVRQYLGIEYKWSLRVWLQHEDVTGAALGGSERLGYSAWLGTQPQAVPRGDLVFSPEH
ncbi:type VI secretion system baseplate subunit TssG [Yokenella regensburgei]|uniref:type VI secretion system baseplate subunit TssG n=1 Tax=Yokenella regensburgei TaxID=158877 RepID=UPI003F134C69